MARSSAAPAMTVSPVVAPARAIAPVHEVGATHLVADDPTNHGADRSKDDRTHAGTNADPFDRSRPGGDWAYTQQGRKGCGGCKTAHGLPLWVRRMMNGTVRRSRGQLFWPMQVRPVDRQDRARRPQPLPAPRSPVAVGKGARVRRLRWDRRQ